jgi:uncharacterized protein (DUF2141 family)
MKKITGILIVFCCGVSCYGQGRLELTVKNINGSAGTIRVGLFNNSEDFLKNAIQGRLVKIMGKVVKVIFENLPEGEYAVSIIHDANENEKLDTDFLGIPKEGFGFGNNAMGTFGPPDFEKAKIKIQNATVSQEVSLKYM